MPVTPRGDGELEDMILAELGSVMESLNEDENVFHLDSMDDLLKKKMHMLMMEDTWSFDRRKFAGKILGVLAGRSW